MSVSDLTNTTWIINETPSMAWSSFHINFISNNNNYNYIWIDDEYNPDDDEPILVKFIEYGGIRVWSSRGGWANTNYRTIEITGGNDVTNPYLISWLEANATQQSSINDLTNTTWLLNEPISWTFPSGTQTFTNLEGTIESYNINFASNSNTYNIIRWCDGDSEYPAGGYGSLLYGTTSVYNVDMDYFYNQAYRTITITGGTDATNSNLISWLESNATQQTPPAPSGTNHTHLGSLSIIKKHFGDLEIIKEVLNGQTIYETGATPTPPTPTYPSKSDVITMDLDGNGSKRYRVLKNTENKKYLVVAMYGLQSTPFDSVAGSPNYFGRTLDTYLNTTWYNTLTQTAKSAIVQKTIFQYSMTHLSSQISGRSSDASTTKTAIDSASRYVYAISVADVDEYFNYSYSVNDLKNTFGDGMEYVEWTRDKDATHDVGWIITPYTNGISHSSLWSNFTAVPSFEIDLSKISFTIEA